MSRFVIGFSSSLRFFAFFLSLLLAVWHSSIPFACNYPTNLFELSTAAVTNSNREREKERETHWTC